MLTQIFVDIDDFMKEYEPIINKNLITDSKKRQRDTQLSMSENMTIVVYFHRSGYRNAWWYVAIVQGLFYSPTLDLSDQSFDLPDRPE